MIISSCPSCHEPVTVPHGAGGSARVRCPLCSDEFLLSVVLEKLPPALVLLDAPAPAPSAAVGDAEVSLAPDFGGRTAGSPAFEFEESAAPGTKKTVSPSARPKRKEKSVAVEMIKVVGGGVVGLGLAVLILWWVAGRDPFDFGPKVSAYAPWMVPEKFRGKTDQGTDNKSDSGTSSSNNKSGNKSGGLGNNVAKGNNGGKKSGTNGSGSGSGGIGAAGSTPTKPVDKPEVLQGDPFSTPEVKKPDDGIPDIGLPVVGPKPKETKPKETKPKETTPKDPPVDTATPKRFDLAKNLTAATASDLDRALKTIESANADIEIALSPAVADLSTEKKLEFSQTYYNAIAKLGEVLISVDPADPEIQTAGTSVSAVLDELAKNTPKQRLLAALAERSLKATSRANGGLCVIGTVKRIEPKGKLFEVDVELVTKNKSVVTVVASVDPNAFYKVGSRAMLLGAMVADPATNLSGYEGEAAEVGCVHVYVPLAAEAEKPAPADTPAKPAEKPEPEAKPAEKPAEKDAPAKPDDEEAK